MGISISQKRAPRSAWETRFNELESFYKKHGKLPSQKDNVGLYFWVINCRNRLKYQKLPDHIKSRFDQVGINLQPEKRNIDRANWVQVFTELEHFINRHGRHPSYSDPNEKKLYKWLGAQKTAHRRGKLSPEKWERLEMIGIFLGLKPAQPYRWEMRFKQAEAFLKKHGRLPTKKEDKVFYFWLYNTRRLMNLQKLPLDVLLRFESAGINLRRDKSHKNWNGMFNELKHFIREQGRFPALNENEKKLFLWLGRQKTAFKKGKLPAIRYQQLNDIGISFLRIRARIFTDVGKTRMKEADAFFRKHGRLPTQVENKRLYSWLTLYRTKLKSQNLIPDIRQLFEEAGIDLLLLGRRIKTK